MSHEQSLSCSDRNPNGLINLLNASKGNTNQATITIGDVKSINLADPPCLRVVSFKVADGRLNLSIFFRSWDIFAGLPENLGGLQMLKECVLANLDEGLRITDGHIIAYSDGAHIYSQYFDIVDSLNVDKIKVCAKATEDQAEFANQDPPLSDS